MGVYLSFNFKIMLFVFSLIHLITKFWLDKRLYDLAKISKSKIFK